MAKVTITYFGVEASGRNVTEAKKAAGAMLERFVKNYEARTVHVHGWLAVLWPMPEGGIRSTTVLTPTEYRGDNGCCSYSCHSMDDEIACKVLHFAQNCTEELKAGDEAWQQIADYKLRKSTYNEYRHWLGFQAAYKAAPDELEDMARHGWACDHAHEFTTESAA